MLWQFVLVALGFLIIGYGVGLFHSFWKKGKLFQKFKKQLEEEQKKAIKKQREIDEQLLAEFNQKYQEHINQLIFESAAKPSSDDILH